MADSYLIDGYNLIHALGMLDRQLADGALEDSRRRLFEFLKASFGDAAARVTIVFDAEHAPRHVPHQYTYHGLHIQFAAGPGSADDRIETLIDEEAAPRSLIVISNDSRLQQAAHHRGARAWTHTELLDFLEKRQTSSQPALGVEEKQGGPMSAEEKAHWMQEFKGLERDPEFKEFFDLDQFED